MVTTQMVLADRLIAGVYVALNFQDYGEMQVLINDKAVVVVEPKYP